jgi:hypothetical protein
MPNSCCDIVVPAIFIAENDVRINSWAAMD